MADPLTNLNKGRTSRRKSTLDLSTMVYGKVPPQARELEEAVLGAVLLESKSIFTVSEILKPECFYVDAHQRIYKSMLLMMNRDLKIDTLTICEFLRTSEELELIGGPYYISKLTNSVVSTANIESHCRIIFQKSIQRRVIQCSGEAISDGYEDSVDPFDLLNLSIEKFQNISHDIPNVINVGNIAFDVVKKMSDKVINARNGIVNENDIYTHIWEWDEYNGSLFPGLYVVAGRPGMGKGVVMTELACRMSKNNPIGIINGEMTNEQLLIRIGCNLTSMDNMMWKKNPENVTDEELSKLNMAMEEAMKLKIMIEDSCDLHTIVAKIRSWVIKHGAKAILIDFLTLITVSDEIGKYMQPTEKLNYIMNTLRLLCKQLNVPIFLFAQLNRENLKRGGNREPNLGDLKGSGNIEEFAYQIVFLHRPEYYEIMEDDMGESTKNLLYMIIAKHRDGKIGRFKMMFLGHMSQINKWNNQMVPGWNPKKELPPF